MIRFWSTFLLLLFVTVLAGDAVHGWSHVEVVDLGPEPEAHHRCHGDHSHHHEDSPSDAPGPADCHLCDWENAIVPEPIALDLLPEMPSRIAGIHVPGVHPPSAACSHSLLASADRGPPAKVL